MALIWSDWFGKLWWYNSYSLFLLLSMPLTQSPLTWLERGLEELSCIIIWTNFLDLNLLINYLIYYSYLLCFDAFKKHSSHTYHVQLSKQRISIYHDIGNCSSSFKLNIAAVALAGCTLYTNFADRGTHILLIKKREQLEHWDLHSFQAQSFSKPRFRKEQKI